jgi:hypothetical protein
MSQQKQISIKGSSKIVSEFFCYAVQAILFQRGVYPEDQFERKQEYDIPLQVSKVSVEHTSRIVHVYQGKKKKKRIPSSRTIWPTCCRKLKTGPVKARCSSL